MELGFFLYKDVRQVRAAARILRQLYAAFMEHGASLVEINPLVTTKGRASWWRWMRRCPSTTTSWSGIRIWRRCATRAPKRRAKLRRVKANLTFIKLDGNVGCVVNGAGLAMATMDLVKYYGGEPANFLDIGGSSNPEKVVNALRIITSDPAVRVILFNIFGGITRTDDVATGIVSAIKQHPLPVPIVIRLTGHQRGGGRPHPGQRGTVRDDGHGRGGARCRGDCRGGEGGVSIFIDRSTRLLVQGITGRDGSFHTRQMAEYGTVVVGGVTPGKGGQTFDDGPMRIRIYNTVAERCRKTRAPTSTVIYVPPLYAADAIMEAAAAGIPLIVCITEGVPVLDMTRVYPFVRDHGARLIGPNCPGLISPGACKVGIIPGRICAPGPIGLVSRSGTLTYEVVYHLTRVGLGADDVRRHWRRSDQRDEFHRLSRGIRGDPATVGVVMIGEIGGTDEQDAARYVAEHMTQARRGLHCRTYRAARPADGARGSDHFGRDRDSGRKSPRADRGRDPCGGAAGRCRATAPRAAGLNAGVSG